ncbi:MAG: hypothetical protein WD871_05760 [Xanthobacteraceae bacterium]
MGITRRAFVAGSIGAALSGPPVRGAAPRWIDVHLHTIGGPKRQFGEAVERAVAEMDGRGMQKAVVFPPPYPSPTVAYDYKDYVPELKRYPGRFGFLAGGGTLNPAIQQYKEPSGVTSAIRQSFVDLAKEMLDAGAVGFGEIAALHFSLVPQHAFEEVPMDHPLLYALLEVAGTRQAVIDLHMDPVLKDATRTPANLKVPPNPPTLKGNIPGFEKLLAHERNARIVWAHGGSDFTGNMTPALIGRLMDAHPNLYMSLRPVPPGASAANAFNLRFYNLMVSPKGIEAGWLALLKRHPNRFVMGADAFILSSSVLPEGPLAALGRGNEGRFTAAHRLLSLLPADLAQKIAVDNAVRLYKL